MAICGNYPSNLFAGSGSIIVNYIKILNNTFIKAGSLIEKLQWKKYFGAKIVWQYQLDLE